MQNLYKNKKIGIWGLGVTGISVYKNLLDNITICYDDSLDVRKNFISQFPNAILNDIDSDIWKSLDYIVVSPGIPSSFPYRHKIFDYSKKYSIEIISDLDLLYLMNQNKIFIGVTGTNGKSTVINMLEYVLQDNGRNFVGCGNIGVPALSVSDDVEGYLIEISSFQLELIKYLKLDVACILNITDDHLDRYETVQDYINTKLSIFSLCHGLKLLGIDSRYTSNIDYHLWNNMITISENKQNNIINKNYVIKIVNYLGLNKKNINSLLNNYSGLPHRMEYIGQYYNLRFFNDSKSTNVDSTIFGIQNFNNVVLIAGGRSKKNSNYSDLINYLNSNTKLYLFGENKFIIADVFSKKFQCSLFNNLEDAFKELIKDNKDNNYVTNIIFSPMSASFDQFKNFEDRGNMFRLLCKEMIK